MSILEFYTRQINTLNNSLNDLRSNIHDIAMRGNDNDLSYIINNDQRFMIDLYTSFFFSSEIANNF